MTPIGMTLVTGSLRSAIAAAVWLASAAGVQAQRSGPFNAPSATAQISARAAANANQALAGSPTGQPATLPDEDARTVFDPNAIHYPYGRYSLGNVDPASATNPYSPYGSLPSAAGTYGHFGNPAPIQSPPAREPRLERQGNSRAP